MFDLILNNIELGKVKYSGLKRIFDTPKHLQFEKIKGFLDVKPILFILIYDSHLKYFLSIAKALENKNINYSIISLKRNFADDLKPYSKRIISLSNFYKKHHICISALLQFFTFIKYRFLGDHNRAFATLKFFKDFYLIRIALNNIISQNNINSICMYKGDGIYAQTIGHYIHQKHQSIKVIVMQHGLIASIPQYKKLPIDEFWVWSSFFKNRLNQLGVNYNIKIMGDPTTDSLLKQKENQIPQTKNKLKLLFLPNHGNSHTPKSQVINTLHWIVKYAIENLEYFLAIKPHPGDSENIILRNINNASQISNLTLISKDKKVLVENYDIIIINNSTIGMEAALNKKPVIILAENKEQVMVKQYIEYGIADVAYNYNEFVNKINFVKTNYSLFQEKTKLFIDEMYEHQGESKGVIIKELLKYN